MAYDHKLTVAIYRRICAEERHQDPDAPHLTRRQRAACMARAQGESTGRGRQNQDYTEGDDVYRRLVSMNNAAARTGMCWCGICTPYRNKNPMITYDDWGSGPSCVMCGKERRNVWRV